MKKLLIIIMASVLIFSISSTAYCVQEAKAEAEPERVQIYEAAPPREFKLTREMFSFELLESRESERLIYDDKGVPEMEKTRIFVHNIVDAQNSIIAVMTVTVKGIYSQADNYAYLTSISASFSGPLASGCTYNSSINGANGSLVMYYYSAALGNLSYHISTNGNITES